MREPSLNDDTVEDEFGSKNACRSRVTWICFLDISDCGNDSGFSPEPGYLYGSEVIPGNAPFREHSPPSRGIRVSCLLNTG